MKKVLLALTLVPSIAGAQAVLNSSEMLPVGGTMTLKPTADFTEIDTTIQGANSTWNFSGLAVAPGQTNLLVTIVAPSSTPYGSNFPTANYAYAESPVTAYRYFNLTSTKMERVGSWYGGTLKTYSDPQIEYVFPFQLGTENFDTWDNDGSWDGGTYQLECVGTGTLILPGGEWDDALMVRVKVEETDLLEFDSYFWYSSTTGAVLVQYIPGDGFFIPETARFENGSGVGIEERPALEFLTWVNPVATELRLETRAALAGATPWRVVSPTGAIVRTGQLLSSGGVDRWTIDVQDLPAGMYVLCLGDDAGTTSLRFIKE